MALFGRKKEAETTTDTSTATKTTAGAAPSAPVHLGERTAAEILIRPHITEKAFTLSQRNVYTFVVAPEANAHQIAKAVKDVYGVNPKKVNIVRKQPREKRSLVRNRVSHQPGLKKAYIHLREGDTINFM